MMSLIKLSCLVGVLFTISLPALCQETPESRALAVAKSMTEAMGGREAYDNARYLTFRFVPTRNDTVLTDVFHAWDRHTGDYVVQGTSRDGDQYKVAFNVDTREGQAWLNEVALEGEDLASWLDRGHGRFINDTYWLLMPWKWTDPGVVLYYEDTEEIDGVVYDRIRLEFETGVGRTSGDRYWGWVSQNTHLMDRWGYVLQDDQGAPGSGEPTLWIWKDWVDAGDGVFLSATKKQLPGSVSLTFPLAKFHRDAPPELSSP
jgi:hypothetical protein